MKKWIFTLALVCAMNLGFSQSFEGIISYKADYEGESVEAMRSFLPDHYIFKIKGQNVRMNIKGGMMETIMGDMLVTEDLTSYVIRSDQKIAYELKKEDIEAELEEFDSTSYEVVDLNEKEKILKYKCNKYKIISEINGIKSEQIVWVTDEIKMNIRVSEGTPASQFSLHKYGIEGMMLKMEADIDQAGMSFKMIMEADEIDMKKLNDDEFKLPEDYEIKSFDEFEMGF